MSIQRVIVHGGVQGVNYRSFVEDNAKVLGLEGWVRNLRDGTVEAVFSGPDIDVTAIIARCWKPSPPARTISPGGAMARNSRVCRTGLNAPCCRTAR